MPINTEPRAIKEGGPSGKNTYPRPSGGPNPSVQEAEGPTNGRPVGNPPMSNEAFRLESGAKSPVPGFSQGDLKKGYKDCGSVASSAKSDPMEPA